MRPHIVEDACSVGTVRVELKSGEKFHFIISTEEKLPEGNIDLWKAHEVLRMQALGDNIQNTFLKDLVISGDQFVVWRQSSKSLSLIAGYHWFTDWGRDTMIAMRGLIIATGKKQIAESILRTFLQYLDRGMIPNRFPDEGQSPEYNTIDATLWLFVAAYEYYEQFKDLEFIRSIYPSLASIIVEHEQCLHYRHLL